MFKRGSCKINFVCLDDITGKHVDLNPVVYNPQVYKADFTELEKVNAEGVLSKSIEQYHQILKPIS